MPVAMYIDPDGIVHITHSASAGGMTEAEFMARASGWAGAIGPSHTVWITDASAPEVAGGRVHTVYGGVANTVWELKDLNAPIELEGEPMHGPAAQDSASDKLDVFCTKRGIGKPMPLQAPKAILITNPSSYISGSSSAAPKAAPPIYRPPEDPPPPLGCPKPPTLISCSGCDVRGRLHGDGPFILRLASSCRQEEEREGAWSMLAQRRLLADYTFWCPKCDPTTQLMSTWADTALATPQQTNPPPGLELMDPYHSVGCHSDEEEDHEEEDHEEEEDGNYRQTKEEIEEEMRINAFWFSTGPSIEKSELFGRQIQRMFGVQYDPDATRTTFAANADQDETQTPPLPSWPHRLAPFGRIAWQRGVQCTKCRFQMEDQYTQHMQMQRMEREEQKRREARTKISEELPETPSCGHPGHFVDFGTPLGGRKGGILSAGSDSHHRNQERERGEQGLPWRPLTRSEVHRFRFSSEDRNDHKDIIRGYCVHTIMGMRWFKPHDNGMGQFPVDELNILREQFTRDHPNIALQHGLSYCIIDPPHLKSSYVCPLEEVLRITGGA